MAPSLEARLSLIQSAQVASLTLMQYFLIRKLMYVQDGLEHLTYSLASRMPFTDISILKIQRTSQFL